MRRGIGVGEVRSLPAVTVRDRADRGDSGVCDTELQGRRRSTDIGVSFGYVAGALSRIELIVLALSFIA